MAIYHYHREIGKRAEGKNAVFAVAYIRAEKRTCDKIESTKDFSNKGNVVYKNTLLPHDAPEWAKNLRYQEIKDSKGISHQDKTGEQFSNYAWNQIEFIENRSDSQLYYHDDIALPNDLEIEDAIELTEAFVQEELCRNGLFCDVAIHWEEGNHHIHVITPTRSLSETGFDKKLRMTKQELSQEVTRVRAAWAEYANRKMQECGIQQRIDHRSYQDRGLELTPTIKVGKFKYAAQEVITQRKQSENHHISVENAKRIIENPEIIARKISQEHINFSGEIVRDEISKVIAVINHDDLNQSFTKDDIQLLADDVLKRLQDEFHIINEQEIKRVVLDKTEDKHSFDEIYNRVITHDDIMYLGLGDDGRKHFVSRFAFDMENRIISNSAYLSDSSLLSCQYEKALSVSSSFGLNDSQMRAMIHLTSKNDIALVCGYAGTGKTYLLNAAKKVWDDQNLKVIGLSTSGKATAGLEDETGIKSYTIAGFLKGLRTGGIAVDNQTVLVMDEMGMTSMDDMDEVLKIARTQGAKFTGVGDIEQTQPVGRGASFRTMVDEVGAVYLDEIVRQKVDWQKEATYYFETNQTAKGLDLYETHGKIHFSTKEDEAQEQLISDWMTAVSKQQHPTLDGLVIAAFTNDAVDELNNKARAKLIEQGILDKGDYIGGQRIAVGERLLFTKNSYRAGYRNGHFATVNEIKEQSLIVTLDNGKQIELGIGELKNCRYGYAATIHKLQGYTGDRTFLMIDGRNWDRHLLLVGGSRHRYDLNIYASKDNFSHTQELKEVLSRHGLNDTLYDYPVAYASRRGYDLDQAANVAAGKISRMKTKVYHGLSYLFNLQHAVESMTQKQAYQLSRSEIEQRRNDAVIVAEFSDNRIEIARLMKTDKEAHQADIYRLRVANGKLAETILEKPSHFKLACERNRITSENLNQSFEFYKNSEIVGNLAAQFKNNESVNYEFSYQLTENIKVFYPHVCATFIDQAERNAFLNHITHESHVLRRDKAFEHFGVEHRMGINLIMRYIQTNYQINQSFQQDSAFPDKEKEALFTLLQERDRQAYEILKDNKTEELIEFFHLDKNRLEQHAQSYQDRLTVVEFDNLKQTEFSSPGILRKQYLAQQFKNDTSRFSKHILSVCKDGFKSVNLENWRYEQRVKKAFASSELKKSFKLIGEYKTTAGLAYQSWKKVFACKQPYSEAHQQKIRVAQGFTYQRMRMARKMMANLSSHLAVLSAQKVDTKRLAQDARVVDYIERYMNERKEPLKLHMANYMLMNMKQYRAGLAHLGLEQEVFEKASHYKYLKSIKASHSAEHKQLIKLCYLYKKQAIDAAVSFKQFKYYQARNIQPVSEQIIMNQVFYKRNEIAAEIATLIKKSPDLNQEIEAMKVDIKKIHQQSASFDMAKNKNSSRAIKTQKKSVMLHDNQHQAKSTKDSGQLIDYTVAEQIIKENYGLSSVHLNDLKFDKPTHSLIVPLIKDFNHHQVEYVTVSLDNLTKPLPSSGFYIANKPEHIKNLYVTNNILDAKALALVEPDAMVVMASSDNYAALSQQLQKASINPKNVIFVADNHTEQLKRDTALNARAFFNQGADIYLAKGRSHDDISHIFIHESFARADKIRGIESFVHRIKLDPVKVEKTTLKSRFSKLLRQKDFDAQSLKGKTRPVPFKPLPYYISLNKNEKEAISNYLAEHQALKDNDSLEYAKARMYQAKIAIDMMRDKVKQLVQHPQYGFLHKELSSNEIKDCISLREAISISDLKAVINHLNKIVIDKQTVTAIENYGKGVKERMPIEALQNLFNKDQLQLIKEFSDNQFIKSEAKTLSSFSAATNSQKLQMIRDIDRHLTSSKSKGKDVDVDNDRSR